MTETQAADEPAPKLAHGAVIVPYVLLALALLVTVPVVWLTVAGTGPIESIRQRAASAVVAMPSPLPETTAATAAPELDDRVQAAIRALRGESTDRGTAVAATQQAAVARVADGALPPAPDPALVEHAALGPLPRIGADGRGPWRVYARPFDPGDRRPRIAVVVSTLGLSSAATEAAIRNLPGQVTLAFQPYAENLEHWIGLARAAGHEVLINLPMEPLDYPTSDPGPRALFTALTPEQNLDRLEWVLSRVSGYVGVADHMGTRFTASPEAMSPILAALKARGLLFLDTRATLQSVGAQVASRHGVPRAINDRFLDDREVSRLAIDAQLAEVERIAADIGISVAIGQPYPVTIERLRAWLPELRRKGFALAPISAVVNLQADR